MEKKEAIEIVKKLYNDSLFLKKDKEAMVTLIPELKENEDEKIRKAIHIYLDWLDGRKDYAPRGEYSIRDMIAWLEKQGEEGTNGNEREIPNSEQNPAWSEEDKNNLNAIYSCVNSHYDGLAKDALLTWLKSLRPQNTWNPSEAQM